MVYDISQCKESWPGIPAKACVWEKAVLVDKTMSVEGGTW